MCDRDRNAHTWQFNGHEFVELAWIVTYLFGAVKPDNLNNPAHSKRTIIRYIADTGIAHEDVYIVTKAGNNDTTRWLRTDIFDSMMITSYGKIDKWTPARRNYILSRYPSTPIPGLNVGCPWDVRSHDNIMSEPPPTANTMPNTLPRRRPLRHRCSLSLFKHVIHNAKFTAAELWAHLFQCIEKPEITFLSSFGFTAALISHRRIMRIRKIKSKLFAAVLIGIFPRYNEKENLTRIYMELATGTVASALTAIRQILTLEGTNTTLLPSKLKVQKMAKVVTRDFISFFKPKRSPTGFYVDLDRAARFLLKILYGKDATSFKGVRIDFWGDAMKRGPHDVTRIGMRILTDNEDDKENPSNAQSSSYLFCVASFRGKDSRENLVRNLASFEKIGERGWFYKQTQSLRDQGAILTVTGDSPFLLHLCTNINSDNTTSVSKLPMYIKEVCEADIIQIEEEMAEEAGQQDAEEYNVRVEQPDEFKRRIQERGGVFSSDVDPTTGRRTELAIDLLDGPPTHSLISIPSIQSACPDPLHGLVRIVEAIFQRIAQNLYNAGQERAVKKMERNISRRDVKFPCFTFEVVTGKDKTTKIVSRPSFSGTNALIILADHLKDMPDAPLHIGSIFNGVYTDDPIGRIEEGTTPAWFLSLIQPQLVSTDTDNLQCYRKRQLAEAHLGFLRDCFKMLRGRAAWGEEKITNYKLAVDSFYLSTLVLFSGTSKLDFTPYMMKLDLMWRLVKNGHIKHIWNHMGEAGEKSHHLAQKLYHANTMRGGGRLERNVASEFSDLVFSYLGICRVAMSLKKLKRTTSYADISINSKTMFEILPTDQTETYLEICRQMQPLPTLKIGKNTPKEQLQGTIFATVSGFTGAVDFDRNPAHKVTKKVLHKMTLSMGGTFCVDMAKMVIMHQHEGYFCLVASQNILNNLKKKTHRGFAASQTGPWRYVNHEFLLQCYKTQTLVDPTPYMWEDPTWNNRLLSQNKHVSHLFALQSQKPDATTTGNEIVRRTVLAAFKRNSARLSGIVKHKNTSKPRFFKKPKVSGKYSAQRAEFNCFRSRFIMEKRAEVEKEIADERMRQIIATPHLTVPEAIAMIPMPSVLLLNSAVAKQWKIEKENKLIEKERAIDKSIQDALDHDDNHDDDNMIID